MQASPGDVLRVNGRRVGVPDRSAHVVEARGPGGTAPFLVRWDDTGHETLFFPGTDAFVEHHESSGASS